MNVENLLLDHRNWMSKWRAKRGAVRRLKTPCCGKRLDVAAPTSKRSQWDSLMVCPYCGAHFMKIVTSEKAIGRMPA